MLLPALALLPLFPSATTTLTADGCWLGEPYAFSEAECNVVLHNADATPLHVDIAASGAKVAPASLEIPANGSAHALVRVDVGNMAGRFERSVRIHSDRVADATVWIRGFVVSALDNPRPEIQFGTVDASGKLPEISLELASHDTTEFRIARVLSHPDGIDVDIDPNGRTLRTRIRDDAPLGIIEGEIKLAIDTPHQREAWVHVSAYVQGDVTIETNPYWFGSVEAGASRQVLVPVTSAAGAPFRVGAVELGMVKGHADVAACEHSSPACKAIRVRFDDLQPAGLTRATLDIELPDQHRHMNVRIWGFLLNDAKSAEAHTVLPAPPQPDFSAPWTEGIVDSVNAPVYALPTVDPFDVVGGQRPPIEPPPGTGPLLKWQTASEGGVYGYQIFRGDSETGPFLLQNTRILRVHAKEYAGAPYFWRDEHATKGTTYWYYIGVVYKDGHKQVLSAPHRKVAE
jgi:hypothetical protein